LMMNGVIAYFFEFIFKLNPHFFKSVTLPL
jgi:hypothetical protein